MKAAAETAPAPGSIGPPFLRIDRLLVYLHFARTRSAAVQMIEAHALRRNRKHVRRGSEQARVGDVLTIALGERVRVIELTALPNRRGPPMSAPSHYREVDGGGLDPKGQFAIAAPAAGAACRFPRPEDRF